MKWFDNTALTLVIIGAVNWLLVGIFGFDDSSLSLWKFKLAFQNNLYDCRPMWSLPHQLVRQNQKHVRVDEKGRFKGGETTGNPVEGHAVLGASVHRVLYF